jgi:hypothetical protein
MNIMPIKTACTTSDPATMYGHTLCATILTLYTIFRSKNALRRNHAVAHMHQQRLSQPFTHQLQCAISGREEQYRTLEYYKEYYGHPDTKGNILNHNPLPTSFEIVVACGYK